MLAVIATPECDPAATAWLAAIRAAHDPLHETLPPHVTLMFPAEIADEHKLRAQLETLASETAAFEVAFDRLDRMEDPHRPKYRYLNVLLADATSAAILDRLHRALTGSTEPYLPHLTISRFGAVYSAKALARQIGGLSVPVVGRIDALELLRLENGVVRTEAHYPFNSHPRT